jgi:5-methylcytosine-specific restriction endonuclease McrA
MKKTCNKCKETKSKFEFNKCKVKRDGLQTKCKVCEKVYYEDNKEKIIVKNKVYRENNIEQRAVTQKTYRENNKEKIVVYKKTHYQENKEEIAVYAKSWRKDNKEQIAVKAKVYNEANKDRIAVTSRAWQQANPERTSASNHKRRALKLNAEGTYTYTDIKNLLTTQNSKCIYCKTDLIITGKGKYHIDHIMPLFLGGTNYPENLQLLCPTCNCSKGSKHPDIYKKQINHQPTQGN